MKVTGLNNAVNATSAGITVTKTAVSEFVDDLSVQNAQEIVTNAFNATRVIIADTANALVRTLVQAKSQLQVLLS